MTTPSEYLPSTSPAAVHNATGRSWQQWFQALDDAGAASMDHRAIVAWLGDGAGLASTWWQQHVAVEYEKARGLRAPVGESAGAGFQLGVRRTLDLSAEDAWRLLTTRPGRDAWLGTVAELPLEKGHRYTTEDGTSGQVRVVRPGARLRLTWQPPGWERPSTLQVTLTARGGRCIVGFHHERLPDAEARQAMRERWSDALDRFAESVAAA